MDSVIGTVRNRERLSENEHHSYASSTVPNPHCLLKSVIDFIALKGIGGPGQDRADDTFLLLAAIGCSRIILTPYTGMASIAS